MITKGQQAEEIAEAVVHFLDKEGCLNLRDLPDKIYAELIEVIFRAA